MERRDVKQLRGWYGERRRAAALDKQKAARKEATDRARQLAIGAAEPDEEDQEDVELEDASAGPSTSGSSPAAAASGRRRSSGGRRASGRHGAAARQYYAAQLMQPEWLTDVPPDLGTDWYALPRPEGQRCLVVAARGQTAARTRAGALLERFSSALPAGGPGQPGGGQGDSFCILDCVFHEPDQTYYVLDLICWKGYSLYDCSAEFRLFWVQSKLEEEGATAPHPTVVLPGGAAAARRQQQPGKQQQQPGQQQAQQQQQQTRRFLPLPAYKTTAGGLQMAHSHPVSFCRDGLLLLHREGRYAPGQQTPLALLWKDAGCSRYVVDTDAAGVPLAQQQAVLEYRMDRTVATQDDPPVVLGRMPDAFVQQLGDRLRPGKLLKFGVGPGGIAFQEGQPVGADLHFSGPANQRRGRADSISKVVFQHLCRTQPITLAQLQAAAAGGGADGGGGGGGLAGDAMGSGGGSSLGGVRSGSLMSGGSGGGGSMAVDAAGGGTDGIEIDG